MYPKARPWSVLQSCPPSRAVQCAEVGATAQGVLRTAVQAYHHQHVLCRTAFGALEHPSPRDDAYHRPCRSSSSHQVQAVASVVCQSPPSVTEEVKLECCHDLTVLSACSLMPTGSSGAAQVLALWWRGSCLYGVLEVLPTPSGHSVRELCEGGALLGASARAWTSLACAGGGCCAALEDLRVIACDPRCKYLRGPDSDRNLSYGQPRMCAWHTSQLRLADDGLRMVQLTA